MRQLFFKKALSAVLAGMLVLTTVPMAFSQTSDTGLVYQAAIDFEGEATMASNSGTMVATTEAQDPLSGIKSLHLEFSDNVSHSIAYNDVVPGAGSTDFTGFVMRLQSTSDKAGLFRVSSGGYYFTKSIILMDTNGKITNPEAVASQDFIYIPAGFDGYVFVPFAGEFSGATFDASAETFPVLIWFSLDGWSNSTAVLDNLGYYKGTDYAAISEQMPKPECLYQEITGFEDGQFFGGNAMGNTPLSMEEAKPLSGERSLKITTKNETGQNRLYADGIKGSEGYDGFVLRLQTNAQEGAAIGIVPRHEDIWPALGDGVTLIDVDYNDVTTPTSSAGDAIFIPEDFDGYLFVPFSGDRVSPKYTSDMDFNLLIHMYACSSWGDEVIFDNFGFYRGNPLDVINQMPNQNDIREYPNPTGTLTHMLFDFEQMTNDTIPFDYDKNNDITVEIDTNTVFDGHGTNSMKINFPALSTDVSLPLVAVLPDLKPVGFDGFIMRMKNTATVPVNYEIYASQQGKEIFLGGSATLLNKNGVVVVAENTPTGVVVPAEFDGYIICPFASAFISKSGYTLYLKINGTVGLQNSEIILDTIAYYRNAGYKDIIEELAPGTVEIEQGDPSIPTGINSHILFNFEDATITEQGSLIQGSNTIIPAGDANITFDIEMENALHDSRSLKVSIGELPAGVPWTYMDIDLPTEKPSDFDGIMLRLKTDAFENAVLAMWIRPNEGGELYPVEFGGKICTKNANIVNMDPAIDTGWKGFYLSDQFNGYAFYPFPDGFSGTGAYHILIAMVGANNYSGSTTFIDSIGYYKGDDLVSVIEEIAPGSIDSEEDDITTEESLYDKIYDIRLNPFISGVLPSTAVVKAKCLDVTDTHIISAMKICENAQIFNLLQIDLFNTRGEKIALQTPVELTIGIPYGMNPKTTRILQWKDNAFVELEVFRSDINHLSFYTSELGTYALVDGFEPWDDEYTQLLQEINTKGEQDGLIINKPEEDSIKTGVAFPVLCLFVAFLSVVIMIFSEKIYTRYSYKKR